MDGLQMMKEEETRAPKNTTKYIWEQTATLEKYQELILDLTMEDQAFRDKYGFAKTTTFTIMEELKETFPYEELQKMVCKNDLSNIYVKENARIKDGHEIRAKVDEEAWENYTTICKDLKDVYKGQVLSEIIKRGCRGVIERKRKGESVVRIPKRDEIEL